MAHWASDADRFAQALGAEGVLIGKARGAVALMALRTTRPLAPMPRNPSPSEFEESEVYFLRPRAASRVTIGRDESNDVRIADPTISQHHARLLSGDGIVRVQDMGSRNGTLVRGALVLAGTSVRLKNGEVLQLGSRAFRYYDVQRFWRILRTVIPGE